MNACPICGEPLPGTASTCDACAEDIRRDMDLLDAKQVRERMNAFGAGTETIDAYIKYLQGDK